MESYSSNIIRKLVAPWKGDKGLCRELENFANYLGWYPSDIIEDKNDSITTGHLFVEHGLENSAVISFIGSDYAYNNLTISNKTSLLGISYNNLVDLHISVDRLNVAGLHNRLGQNNLLLYGSTEDEKYLKSSTYSKILLEGDFKPIYKALDQSIIETISYWKRVISSELNNEVNNEQLSLFFNSIIFLRAIEDYNFNIKTNQSRNGLNRIIDRNNNIIYTEIIEKFLNVNKLKNVSTNLIDLEVLKLFNTLSNRTLYPLFQDFYRSKDSNYNYDFSIMSKHALSRLYEKYVSLLEVKETAQLSLFSPIPEEKFNKNSGSYYTPQFIARFFTKYLENNVESLFEREINFLEPAVGSGIFVRTFLERQIEVTKKANIQNNVFNSLLAIDKNPTACNAAYLSLSLLHLASYGHLPKKSLQIINEDSLKFFKGEKYNNSIDVIISNPPYIKYNSLEPELRKLLKEFLGSLSYGRTDLYIAFIKIAIKTLKKGGYACFVLPNTFLTTDSCKSIREELNRKCNIECIVDLSDNRQKIFEEAGVYPILLVFKKTNQKSNAIIAKIQDNTGEAIHHILNRNFVENDNFSVYEVSSSFFNENKWYLLPPSELNLKLKLSMNPKISDFFDVRTGFASGNVDVFIIPKKRIPKGEEKLFVPYLKDREMKPYKSSENVEEFFFFPFIGAKKLMREELIEKYPKTYKILKKYEQQLSQRPEVRKGKIEWWMPNRPRSRKFMLVSKILTPHLVFTSKFNLDIEGKFAISRSPFLVPKDNYNDTELLYYFTGVLNSTVCLWYLVSHAPKYQHGFAMLEPTYIKSLPIPSPYQESVAKRKLVLDIIQLVKKRILSSEDDSIVLEKRIDNCVAELYNLSSAEKSFLNI